MVSLLKSIVRDLTTFGGSVFYGLVVLLAMIINKSIFTTLLFGYMFSLLIVVLIRTFYFKDRPRKQQHHTFLQRIDASSFPSWHAARAVFLVMVFVNLWVATSDSSNFVALLLAAFTLLVCYSRIYLKKHDWIDILGGVVLGVLTYWISIQWIFPSL